jgi:hypothetical protein
VARIERVPRKKKKQERREAQQQLVSRKDSVVYCLAATDGQQIAAGWLAPFVGC